MKVASTREFLDDDFRIYTSRIDSSVLYPPSCSCVSDPILVHVPRLAPAKIHAS